MKAKPIDLTDWSEAAQERFDKKIRWVPLTGCMVWTGATNSTGYGHFRWEGRVVQAHRLSYALTHGEPEMHLTLDHLCRVRSCVNPQHLEPVTSIENTQRGESFSAANRRKEFCPKGHRLSGDNVVPSQASRGWRSCMECHRQKLKLIGQAHRSLGMTQREYRAAYGSSQTVAREVLRKQNAGAP